MPIFVENFVGFLQANTSVCLSLLSVILFVLGDGHIPQVHNLPLTKLS